MTNKILKSGQFLCGVVIIFKTLTVAESRDHVSPFKIKAICSSLQYKTKINYIPDRFTQYNRPSAFTIFVLEIYIRHIWKKEFPYVKINNNVELHWFAKGGQGYIFVYWNAQIVKYIRPIQQNYLINIRYL